MNLPVTALPDHTPVTLLVHGVHGARPGPTMFVSGAIHGDEVIGPEIVRRLLRARALGAMAGTLMSVPIVNGFGFLNGSRSLSDRRDLNRSLPGLARGSLAARMGVAGILRVMAAAGIIAHGAAPRAKSATLHCPRSDWLRAPGAGMVSILASPGERVAAGQVIATISDPFGETQGELVAPRAGIVVGRAQLPLAHEGDALFHLPDLPEGEDPGDVLDIPDEDEVI